MRPPHNITVTMTISDVVVRMAFRAVLLVLRMASAKAIAPLRPTLVVIRKENNKKLGKFVYINDADIFFSLWAKFDTEKVKTMLNKKHKIIIHLTTRITIIITAKRKK